jgi:YD repeat-containing protein
LGHLITETNGLGQKTTYSNYNALGEVGTVTGPNGDTTGYTYDVRGRMLSKTTSPNGGTWNYAYDGFGLLASLAAPDGEVTKWVRNSAMRVTSITHNDKDGISTESFTYDVNGDITQHSISRGNTIGFAESYTYDTLGRVYQRFGQNGQSHSYTYDGNGNVLSVTTAVNAIGHTVSYQYDALNRVVKTLDSGGASPPMPSAAATPNAPTSSLNGAYTISWNSVSYATHYVLQEQINGGAWTTVQDGSALSWSTTGRTGGTYSYREQACNATGCGTWSPVVSIQVGVDMSPIINLILDDN